MILPTLKSMERIPIGLFPYMKIKRIISLFYLEEIKEKIRNSNSSDFKDFLKDIKILLNDIEQMKQINI